MVMFCLLHNSVNKRLVVEIVAGSNRQTRPVADIYGLPATWHQHTCTFIPAEDRKQSVEDLQNVINQGRRAPQDTGGGAPIPSPVGGRYG